MKVKLTLKGTVDEATSSTFSKSKSIIPDSARYLHLRFSEQILLSDLLVNFSSLLPSLTIFPSSSSELSVDILGLDAKLVEFVVNLKLVSMKIGKLLFDFENELLSNKGELNQFIKRHEMTGFDLNIFKQFVEQKNYSKALEILYTQYQNLKKAFFVLYKDRYTLLDSYGYI